MAKTRDRLSLGVLVTMTAIGVALVTLLASPFLPGLVWAFAFAVVAGPLQARLRKRWHRPSLAAAVGVVAVALILVLPTMFVIWQVGNEARRGLQFAQEQLESGRWRESIRRSPRLAQIYDTIAPRVDFTGEVKGLVSDVPAQAGQWLRAAVSATVQLFIALFTLFFFFRDRNAILKYFRGLMPLSAQETDYLFERIRGMTHATIYGTVVVSLIQGALGGLIFLLLGIPGAFLWGVVMAVLSIVPNLGAFIIWIPAAIVLATQGAWIKAVILAGWGTFVVGTIDNVL